MGENSKSRPFLVVNLYSNYFKSQNKYLKFEIFIMVLKSYEQNKKVINKMHFKKRKLSTFSVIYIVEGLKSLM